MSSIFDIIPAKEFRNTKNVQFHSMPVLNNLKGLDLVKHEVNAISPGEVNNVQLPWYMHPNQVDNLIVFNGKRYVELYRADGKEMVKLEVTPDKIVQDGKVLYEGPALLSWPTHTFHRIKSGEDGSYSLNFAVREEDFDIRTNFNIYDLNLANGEAEVIREGHKDQIEIVE